MLTTRLSKRAGAALTKSRAWLATPTPRFRSISRVAGDTAHAHTLTPESRRIVAPGARPRLRPPSSRQPAIPPWQQVGGRRTIFIQTETTPNADALKFIPNHRVLPEGVASPFIEYLTPRATVTPPYPSPLAAQLLALDGVAAVFYGPDFITVTKANDAVWAHLRPEVFALITEAIVSGRPLINLTSQQEHGAEGMPVQDSLSYDENDSEVVGMIKELLETRIRPAIQEDGGDIEFRGFENGYVKLKLRGSCRTCDQSTNTLKQGIEGMLMHYIEEVKGVHPVLDKEEEIALEEFEKFEEKLKKVRGETRA